jgi:hypothetical protein
MADNIKQSKKNGVRSSIYDTPVVDISANGGWIDALIIERTVNFDSLLA